ncbi:MAG: non-canonical purine NTP pyrophosphatase, partial [Burkholderiaceae bacterium]
KKLVELQALFAPLGIELVTQGSLGIPEAEEPFESFVENALTKARHASRLSGLPALADDSGLCVPVLGYAPGVRSARYAGEPKDDQRNNQKLIAALQQSGSSDWTAFYVVVLALVRFPHDPMPLIVEARWNGRLVAEARGSSGFGYDPHFFVETHGCTAAELQPSVKNVISHRGQAVQYLLQRRSEWAALP